MHFINWMTFRALILDIPRTRNKNQQTLPCGEPLNLIVKVKVKKRKKKRNRMMLVLSRLLKGKCFTFVQCAACHFLNSYCFTKLRFEFLNFGRIQKINLGVNMLYSQLTVYNCFELALCL